MSEASDFYTVSTRLITREELIKLKILSVPVFDSAEEF